MNISQIKVLSLSVADQDIAKDRENEPAIDFKTFVKELKADGLL